MTLRCALSPSQPLQRLAQQQTYLNLMKTWAHPAIIAPIVPEQCCSQCYVTNLYKHTTCRWSSKCHHQPQAKQTLQTLRRNIATSASSDQNISKLLRTCCSLPGFKRPIQHSYKG
eukprot:1602966-Amphidinium_carterae.1